MPIRSALEPPELEPKTSAEGLPAVVPFVDLVRLHGTLGAELEEGFARVLASGRFHLGPETAAFEREFAAHEGAAFGVACGSGSDALYLALRTLDIGAGHAVVTVSNSFLATAESIARTGAEVLFADADPRTRCLDPADLARLLGEEGAERVRAVIPVHLYGHPADIEGIHAVLRDAGRTDIQVVGDAAQAHGIEGIGGRTSLTCYSFYPAKNLGALGDGGIVLCDDEATRDRLLSLRNHGRGAKHMSIDVGLNSRFDEIQAAALRAKLRRLRHWNRQRRAIAAAYAEQLDGLRGISLPHDHREHVYHLYVVEADDREALAAALKARGIGTGMHYPVPVHHMPPYPSGRNLPVTDRQCERCLTLPMFPGMRDDEVEAVCHAVQAALS